MEGVAAAAEDRMKKDPEREALGNMVVAAGSEGGEPVKGLQETKMFKMKTKSFPTVSLEIYNESFDWKFWAGCGCSGLEVPREMLSERQVLLDQTGLGSSVRLCLWGCSSWESGLTGILLSQLRQDSHHPWGEFLTPSQTTEQFNQIRCVQMFPHTDCWALTQCPVSWLDSLPVSTVFRAACLYTENPFRSYIVFEFNMV